MFIFDMNNNEINYLKLSSLKLLMILSVLNEIQTFTLDFGQIHFGIHLLVFVLIKLAKLIQVSNSIDLMQLTNIFVVQFITLTLCLVFKLKIFE